MVIGPDGRMNDAARAVTIGTQEEASERVRLVSRARSDREAGELPALGRTLRAVRIENRAAHLAPMVVRAMGELKKPAIEALRERRVRYHPESQHAS